MNQIEIRNKIIIGIVCGLLPILLFSNAACAATVTYYLNATNGVNIGADGTTANTTTGTTAYTIPPNIRGVMDTTGLSGSARSANHPTGLYNHSRWYLTSDYPSPTQISANPVGNISARGASTGDTVIVRLYDYDPAIGTKTLIGSSSTISVTATTTSRPYTISSSAYTVPQNHRLMLQVDFNEASNTSSARVYTNPVPGTTFSNLIVTETPVVSTYNLSGYITNISGSGLYNAKVQINSSPVQTIYTNAAGYYNFSGLANGTYLINASLTGYVNNSASTGINGADVFNHNISLSLIPTYIPPTPTGLTPAQVPNKFWINYTWQAGVVGNITNSFNVSHNGSWSNNSIRFRNNTVGPHGWSNITVYAYNSSGTGQLSQTPAFLNTQVNNNDPVLGSIGDKTVTAGQTLTITISATDTDTDPLTNATNVTYGSFTQPNVYQWTPSESNVGIHQLIFNTTDTYGGVDNETITVTVNAANFVPPTPIITDILQANFWINYSWLAGLGFTTDSYNVSVNDFWTNGTTETFNITSVGAHGWSNISVYAYNSSGSGSLNTTPATANTQVANNDPVLILTDAFSVTAGNLLTFAISATDADGDSLTYGTNATKGKFNTTTGVFTWMPSSANVTESPFVWEFNASDGPWGGLAANTTTITVTDTTGGPYINGTVSSGGIGLEGVTVSTNTTSPTTTDPDGFYSIPVTADSSYEVTASLDPEYYPSNMVIVSVTSGVAVLEFDLDVKPKGTITGSVTNV